MIAVVFMVLIIVAVGGDVCCTRGEVFEPFFIVIETNCFACDAFVNFIALFASLVLLKCRSPWVVFYSLIWILLIIKLVVC